MRHNGFKGAAQAVLVAVFFLLMAIPKAFPADRHMSYEIGGGLFYGLWGEETTEKAVGGIGTFALMGKYLGLEAIVMSGIGQNISLGGSLVFTTNSGAPVSAFFSCGGFSHGLLLGTGMRVKVTKNIFVTGKIHGWITYEGGFSFALGAVYRFK